MTIQSRPHPADGPCRTATKTGAVAWVPPRNSNAGSGVFITCTSQEEALRLLRVTPDEPRGEPPAWMADKSLLPKKPPR